MAHPMQHYGKKEMSPEQAIQIVARQLVSNAAREIQWEDIPDVGEQDFLWLMSVMLELTPEQPEFNGAITLLMERAAAWQKEQDER